MRAALAATGVTVFAAIFVFASFAVGERAPATVPSPVRPWHTAVPGTSWSALPDAGRRADDVILATHPATARGFLIPVAGYSLPTALELLPSTAREYRAGIHEGVDFPAPAGTAVLAAKAGTIVRIDSAFTDWTDAARLAALAEARTLGYTTERTLDLIRGRQVWIDHGKGVVTRYCHLASVDPLTLGAAVTAGQRIGTVGSSGYPEGGPHLHFEIRIGAGYLGEGLLGDDLTRVLELAFRQEAAR